jgi:teichuronic acid biosynthesis glycosyltransferase TuaC
MRVLVVTNMWPTETEPWFGCFVSEQVDDLRRLGVDVDVLAFDGRRDRSAYLRAAAGVRARVARGRFDLVHSHYGLTGAVASAQRRLPVVTTFHGSDTGYVPWQGRVSFVVARLTQPVFVSEAAARSVRCLGAPIVPAPVDTELFRPLPRAAARRELGWPEEAPVVLFPGARANRRKRVDLFDAAVAEARAQVPGLVAEALEGYDRAGAAVALAAADVTLMTSDWEGSPVAVRESLACETPVVSVPVGDVAHVLQGLPGCALAPREPAALGAALVASLRSPRDPALRERARQTSRPRMAEQMLAVYRSVVPEAA